MYFGTLVTQTRNDQEQATWKRDLDSANAAAQPGFWYTVRMFFRRWS